MDHWSYCHHAPARVNIFGMRRLLIFVKFPTPGRVKTRLAASIGAQAASDIHRSCTELTLERLDTFHRESILCYDPPEARERMRAWLGARWSLVPQAGRTLGERLAHAVGEAFAQGATQVVAIGTDSPWLGSVVIEGAFDALRRAEVVLGPTRDGGYYLIGLSRPRPALFTGIRWGTASVCASTTAKARALGLRVRSLRIGYDIDRLADVRRFLAEAAAHERCSPRMRQIRALVQGLQKERGARSPRMAVEQRGATLAAGQEPSKRP